MEYGLKQSIKIFAARGLGGFEGAEGGDAGGKFIVPEPALAAFGKDDKGRVEVLRVAPSLLFGVVGVELFALRFEHAEHPAGFIE